MYEDLIEPTQNINDLSMQDLDSQDESFVKENQTWGHFYSLGVGFDATGESRHSPVIFDEMHSSI